MLYKNVKDPYFYMTVRSSDFIYKMTSAHLMMFFLKYIYQEY